MQLIAHTDRVFSIPCFLSANECSQLIELAETSGFVDRSKRASPISECINLQLNQMAHLGSH